MSLPLYMDVHVPAALTEALRERSLDVVTSQEDGTRTRDDESLLQRAAETGRLLLTQDEDFLAIAAKWQQTGRAFPGLFFARQGLPVGRLTKDLELYLSCCTADELRNRVIHLPIQ
jgi:hypothetical protein